MFINNRKQFVLCLLRDQVYGVEIQDVQTIERFKLMMRVPKAPKCVSGVMNLRGEIIPIISIKELLEIKKQEVTSATRIVIVNIEESLIGIIVDAVKEVVELGQEQIQMVQNVKGLNNQYITGVGKQVESDEVITLLNLKTIIEDAFKVAKND